MSGMPRGDEPGAPSTDEFEDLGESLSTHDAVSQLDRFTSSSMTSSRNCVATISGDKIGAGRNVICCSLDRGNVITGRGVLVTSFVALVVSEVLVEGFLFGFGNVLGGAFPWGVLTTSVGSFFEGTLFGGSFPVDSFPEGSFPVGSFPVGSFPVDSFLGGSLPGGPFPGGGCTGGLNFVGRNTSSWR